MLLFLFLLSNPFVAVMLSVIAKILISLVIAWNYNTNALWFHGYSQLSKSKISLVKKISKNLLIYHITLKK